MRRATSVRKKIPLITKKLDQLYLQKQSWKLVLCLAMVWVQCTRDVDLTRLLKT